MANSPNLGLDLQTTGSNNGTWGIVLNGDLSIIDSRLGSTVDVNCAGNSNITVSASQAQNLRQNLTGVLTGNIEYILPDQGGEYIITNSTTGAFTLKVVNVAAGTGVTIPQGRTALVFGNMTANTVTAALSYLPTLLADTLTTSAFVSTGTTSFAAASIDASAIASLPSNPIVPGTVVSYAGSSTPAGWLLCYGQAVSRTTYADLFTAISTTYGIGDGTTTFNIPDCRGRVDPGKDNMGGVSANRLTNSATGGVDGSTLGAVGGEQAHVQITSEIGAHSHGTTGLVTSTAGDHTHGIALTSDASSNTTNVLGSGTLTPGKTGATNVGGSHSHTVTGSIDVTGSSTAFNVVQPSIVFNKIIKT